MVATISDASCPRRWPLAPPENQAFSWPRRWRWHLALLGVSVRAPLRVWVWNGEDPLDELDRRIAAIMIHYSVEPASVEGSLFVDSGRLKEMVIATETPGGIHIYRPTVDAVSATIVDNKLDVFTVDPFVTTHEVNENNNVQIAAVAKTWARIADATGCAIELVHHVRKTSNGGGGNEFTADDARGAGALVAAARSVRVINTMSAKEAERADVDSHRSYFRTDDGKTNLAPPEAARWHRLVSVDLGNATEERPSDQVAVVTTWKWPDPFEDVTTHHLREVQKRVAAARPRQDSQAKDWVGLIVADVLSLDLTDKAAKNAVKSIVKTWVTNDVLRVITENDKQRRPRQYVIAGAPV